MRGNLVWDICALVPSKAALLPPPLTHTLPPDDVCVGGGNGDSPRHTDVFIHILKLPQKTNFQCFSRHKSYL